MEQILAYQASARAKGDVVTITTLDGAGHFDMLAPRSEYGKRVEARFHELSASWLALVNFWLVYTV